VLILICGSAVSLWPDVSLREVGAWSYVRATAGVTSGIMFAVILASSPAGAIDTEREALTRQSRSHQSSRESVERDVLGAGAPELSGLALVRQGITGPSGLSIFGGLLLGAAAVAYSTRSRREHRSR
jgi:hypothetical protein